MTLKRLVIKLFTPGNLSHKTEIIRCPGGTHLEEGPGLTAQMEQFAEDYAKAYPGEKFAVKRVGPGQFNIVSVGEDTAWQS